VRTIFPSALPATLDAVNSSSPPPVSAIAQTLVDELSTHDRPFVLVLDDYHEIAAEEVHGLVARLLRDPPLPLRLVLAARHDPPLPLARLHAAGHVNMIRAGDLRFSLAETRTLLDVMLEAPIDDGALAALDAKTEGWPTGIYLLGLFLRQQDGARLASPTLREIDAYTLDYLATEVLARQPQNVQEMLLKTSIVDRICDPLGSALLSPTAAGLHIVPSLAWLEQQSLFVLALDEERTWYRFHHLFRQLLLRQLRETLSAEEIAALHGRASAWLAAHGLAEEALHHALAAGDAPAAVQIFAVYRHDLINREEWRTLQRWLRLFPRRVVEEQAVLLITEGWLLTSQGQVKSYPPLLARIDALLSQSMSEPLSEPGATENQTQTEAETQTVGVLRADADILRSELLLYSGEFDRAIHLGRQALDTIPENWQLARSYQIAILACAYQVCGDLPQAYAILDSGPREQHAHTEIYRLRLLATRALIGWLVGNLPDMLEVTKRCRPLAEEMKLAETLGWVNYFAGCVHYHWNELATAEEHLLAVVRNSYGVNGNTYANASCALALAYEARGMSDKARAIVETAITFLAPTNPVCGKLVEAFRAELALRQGDLITATRWAAGNHAAMPLQPTVDFFTPQLVLSKILLAQDTPPSRAQAGEILGRLHTFFASIHSTRFLIEVLAVQSLLHNADGDMSTAVAELEQAIHLAEPGGFIRLFVDLGPRLEPILARLARRSVAPAYVARIRAALRQSAPVRGGPFGPGPAAQPGHAQRADLRAQPELTEALTRREMDVLLLLVQRLTNKEIAHELGIVPETVKRHTIAIFGKLGVDNRRAAIERARVFGLVPTN
jgi:LuxR family maltose regulon positive regulatory protein